MLKITRQVTLLLLAGALSFPAYSYATQATEVLVPEVTQEKVTGTVEDALGPVIGASVMVKGTTNGVITDLEGKFSLNDVKKGDIIVISYIGYVTQEIPYTGKPIQVKLAEDSKALEEVVVVGYATVKKANLTGAVSAVDGKVLEDRPIVNLGQGLQGAIPNLNVTTSGRPGQGSSFNIRGTTAMSGSSPLVLVDGVEMDPNLINPQDVKSVSVLKDAASASIYGARAAYGVVLITTKGGRKDQPTQVSFDASVSFNGPTTRPTYMNSMQYATWMNTAQQNTVGRDYFDAEWMQHIEA
ncbi:TonB-dependent receptor plug domain-containing protein, partial [Bacteroides fragilis]